jgi:hypothetical protein
MSYSLFVAKIEEFLKKKMKKTSFFQNVIIPKTGENLRKPKYTYLLK